MTKLNSLKDSPCEQNDIHEQNQTKHKNNNKLEKILCNHCGRTNSNDIRCLGICVADNEY